MASTDLSHLMSLIDYTTISLLTEIKANGFHQLETVEGPLSITPANQWLQLGGRAKTYSLICSISLSNIGELLIFTTLTLFPFTLKSLQ